MELKVEKDVFMYRAYAAQRKYNVILSEIHAGSPAELIAVRRYAEYLSSSGDKRSVNISFMYRRIVASDWLVGAHLLLISCFAGELWWRN